MNHVVRRTQAKMKERFTSPPSPTLRIRRGGAADASFIRDVAIAVFHHLGDYGRILPTWLMHDGVLTHIADEAGVAVGYTMLGFYPVSGGAIPSTGLIADLLAVAVSPRCQGRGVGKRLLAHAIEHVRDAQKRLPVYEIKLSVAESNVRARRMFEQFGFTLVAGEHGYYDGGQVALHMSRPV
jgi:ribosomal protein S18 acetylase RimI-like enzyme